MICRAGNVGKQIDDVVPTTAALAALPLHYQLAPLHYQLEVNNRLQLRSALWTRVNVLQNDFMTDRQTDRHGLKEYCRSAVKML